MFKWFIPALLLAYDPSTPNKPHFTISFPDWETITYLHIFPVLFLYLLARFCNLSHKHPKDVLAINWYLLGLCFFIKLSNPQEGFALLPYVLLYRLPLHKFIFLSWMSFLQHFTDIVEFYLLPLPLVSNSKKGGMFASFCPLLFLLQCLEIA